MWMKDPPIHHAKLEHGHERLQPFGHVSQGPRPHMTLDA